MKCYKLLKLKTRHLKSRLGFTLIELIVFIAISAVLSSLAITYSNVGRNQVALSLEAAKISQFILQAKELAIATYGTSSSCGFGVVFNFLSNPQTYSVFAYSPAGAPPCPAAANVTNIKSNDIKEYTPGTWGVSVAQGVLLTSDQFADGLGAVLFYPPVPSVFLSRDKQAQYGFTNAISNIYLKTTDGQNSLTLSVNPQGQVSF